jgi:hypothetical protein
MAAGLPAGRNATGDLYGSTQSPAISIQLPFVLGFGMQPDDGRMRRLLNLMRPHQAVGQKKIRLGAPGDGGYVLLDDFAGIVRGVGCGVGWDVSFERDLAERGIEIDLFDHTVAGPPTQHARFHFHRIRLGDGAGEDPCVSLDGIAAMYRLAPGTAILKVDIEGDEWALLNQVTPASLLRYRQIVIELHWLNRAGDPQFLAAMTAAMRKLTRDFAVVHVHGNNNAPIASFGALKVPYVLELSLVSRHHYRLRRSHEEFPTALDAPNSDKRPDLPLGRFDFPRRLTDFLPRR